jgi:hypothetical protein
MKYISLPAYTMNLSYWLALKENACQNSDVSRIAVVVLGSVEYSVYGIIYSLLLPLYGGK